MAAPVTSEVTMSQMLDPTRDPMGFFTAVCGPFLEGQSELF